MCRLLAYVAPAPTTFSDVIGLDQAAAFQRLARLHGDGWGTMWLDRDGDLHRRRTPGGGFADADLTNALNGTRARVAVAHLRLATGGLSVDSRNSHPFVGGGAGLAHNGSILPVGELAPLLSRTARRRCQGTTDSEMYFTLVREHLDDGLDLPGAVAATVTMLQQAFPVAGLNTMALDADHLVVVRASTDAIVPYGHFLERGLDEDDLPREHDAAYYDLRMKTGDDGSVAFASTGLDSTGWQELPLDSVTVVDLVDASVRTRSLADVYAG